MALLPIPKPNPADALATFLGVDPAGMGASDGAYSSDPALELSRLRGTRADELKARIPGEQATGDKINGLRDLGNLFQVQGDMAADPDTGVAAHQDVANTEAALNKASLSMRPEITDAANAASAAKIKEARGLSEANAEGPLAAQISPVGKAAAAQKAKEATDLLAAKFGVESQGLVGSSPVYTTPEGAKWQDASTFPHGNLNSALAAAAKSGTRLVTDKNDVASLHDNSNAEQTLRDIKNQILSLLPANAQSRPEAYLNNKLGSFLQTNEQAAAFDKTITPRALELFRTVSGMHGAGGMRLGPGLADLASHIAPKTTDTLGTTLATLDQLSKALANHRQETLGGVVGGGPAAPQPGGGTHKGFDAAGNLIDVDANGKPIQ